MSHRRNKAEGADFEVTEPRLEEESFDETRVFFRATDSLDLACGAGLDAAPCVAAGEGPPMPVQIAMAQGKPAVARKKKPPPAALARAAPAALAKAESAAPAQAGQNPRIAEWARHVAMQRNLEDADVILCRALAELLTAKRAQIIYRNPETGKPFGKNKSGVDRACIELAGQVFASRRPVPPRADKDYTFAFPILLGGVPIAVCVVTRALYTERPFAAADAHIAAALGAQVASTFQTLLTQHAREMRKHLGPLDPAAMFRPEAVAYKSQGRLAGDVVRVSPTWLKSTFWFLIVLGVFGINGLIFIKVDRASVGPALIRVQGDQLTARVPATVSSVVIDSNQAVRKGDLLVELYSADEIASLTEVESEYRTKLAAYLLGQGEPAVRSDLASTAARRERALSAVSQKIIRAPRDGIIRDLRVRAGMPINPGDHIATIEQTGSVPQLIAFLPGTDRPQIKEGMTVKLSVPGYQTLPATARVYEVGTEVIGPAEARRILGGTAADSLPLEGPVTLIKAQLDSNVFADGDRTYEFHDGMPLEAEIILESERLVTALVRGATK